LIRFVQILLLLLLILQHLSLGVGRHLTMQERPIFKNGRKPGTRVSSASEMRKTIIESQNVGGASPPWRWELTWVRKSSTSQCFTFQAFRQVLGWMARFAITCEPRAQKPANLQFISHRVSNQILSAI